MEVKELIELLSRLPDDTEVLIGDDNKEELLELENLYYNEGLGVFIFDADGSYSIDVSIERLLEKEM